MQVHKPVSKIKSLIEQDKSGSGDLVVVEGLHAIKHALRFNAKPEVIFARNKAELLNLSNKLCPDLTEQLEEVSEEVGEQFDDISGSLIRTGVLGLFQKPSKPITLIRQLTDVQSPIVLLDNPKDLDNIGAVTRVCAAADISALIITGDSNPWNSRAIRAAAGLQFAIPIITSSDIDIPDLFKDLPLVSFDERGEALDSELKVKIPKQAVYIFGSERDGISKELKDKSKLMVKLPMKEGVSSLNLATSVAAALYSIK